MSVEVKVLHDKKLGAYNIGFKFSKWEWSQVEAIVAMMKMAIPASDRLYEPASKEWSISAKYYPWLEELFKKSNFNIIIEKVVNPEDFFYSNFTDSTPQVSKETLAGQLVKLLGITPDELNDAGLLKKAYRRKALELHPDRNAGDGTAMSSLNEIWNAYKV